MEMQPCMRSLVLAERGHSSLFGGITWAPKLYWFRLDLTLRLDKKRVTRFDKGVKA